MKTYFIAFNDCIRCDNKNGYHVIVWGGNSHTIEITKFYFILKFTSCNKSSYNSVFLFQFLLAKFKLESFILGKVNQ